MSTAIYKTTVSITTEKWAEVPWPEDVLLPSAGDKVLLQYNSETIAFIVERKLFSIGTDPRSGERIAAITIYGKLPPEIP